MRAVSQPPSCSGATVVTGQRARLVVVGDTDAGRRRILPRRTGTMPAAIPSPAPACCRRCSRYRPSSPGRSRARCRRHRRLPIFRLNRRHGFRGAGRSALRANRSRSSEGPPVLARRTAGATTPGRRADPSRAAPARCFSMGPMALNHRPLAQLERLVDPHADDEHHDLVAEPTHVGRMADRFRISAMGSHSWRAPYTAPASSPKLVYSGTSGCALGPVLPASLPVFQYPDRRWAAERVRCCRGSRWRPSSTARWDRARPARRRSADAVGAAVR